MTLQVNGTDVMAAIEVAAWIGSLVSMLVIGFIVYLMVRPARRRAEAAPPEDEAFDAREMLRLMDRMERRLETLERAVGPEPRIEDRILEAGESPAETRRTK